MSITIPNQGVSKPLLLPHLRTTTPSPNNDQDGRSSSNNLVVGGGGGGSPSASKKFSGAAVRYKECLKNHAAAIGGRATDGCGEFLAGGEEGTLEALKCSACNCHRNFHRKIYMQQQVAAAAAPAGVLRIKGVYAAPAKKRSRTKFDEEQKEKMLRFAEKAEWKMQTADEEEVRSLCEEIGVKRKVLKVWMHNNKYQFACKTNSSH